MDIPAALTALSPAITVVKQLKEIDLKVDEATFKLNIAEATAALAQAKLELLDAQEVIRAKDRELAELRGAMKFRSDNLTRHKGLSYEQKDGKPIGVPYCPSCEDEGQHIRLVHFFAEPGMPWKCPKCKVDMQSPDLFTEEE